MIILAFCKYISDNKHPRGKSLLGLRINGIKLKKNKILCWKLNEGFWEQESGKVSNTRGAKNLINSKLWLVYEIGCVT